MGHLDKYSDDELFDILGSDVEEEIRSRGYEYGWHKKVTYPGSIYVLVNPAFPNLVKIGYADDVAKRVKSLNRNSGLPSPFHVYATYKVKKRLEDLRLHGLIDALDPDLRYAANREFFEMTAEAAYEMLSAIAQINGDEELLERNPLGDAFFADVVGVIDDGSSDISEDVGKTWSQKGVVPDGTYYMKRKIKRLGVCAEAEMRVEGGKYIVPKGTKVILDVRQNQLSDTNLELRDKFVDGNGVVVEDVQFRTPSGASDFVIGGSSDGWHAWKCADGEPIDVYR